MTTTQLSRQSRFRWDSPPRGAVLLPPPFPRKTLETPKSAEGELADGTRSCLPRPSLRAGGRRERPIFWTFPETPGRCPCQPLCQPRICRGREGMRGGRRDVPTGEGRKGQGQGGAGTGVTGGARACERAHWCGFGGAPGDRRPAVINLVGENRFSPPATKSAEADDEAVSSVLRRPRLCEEDNVRASPAGA